MFDIKHFIILCNTSDIESGCSSDAEMYLDYELEDKMFEKIEILYNLYKDNTIIDKNIKLHILDILSHMDIKSNNNQAIAIVVDGLYSNDVYIQDEAIKCFENWKFKEGIYYLQLINLSPNWLQSYRDGVIEDILNEQK